MVDDGDAVAELVGFIHVVRGHEDGEIAFGLEAGEHFPDGDAGDGVEAGGGFVEEEDFGFVDEAAGDFEAAAHAAGEHFDGFVGPLEEVDFFEELVDDGAAFVAGHAVELGEDGHVFFGGEVKVGSHGLGDDADDFADVVGMACDVDAVDGGLTGGDGDEGGEHADEGGFSGAVGAEESEDFAVVDVEGEGIDGGEVAEAFGEVLDIDGEQFSPQRDGGHRGRTETLSYGFGG